jgi:hypothetical protein
VPLVGQRHLFQEMLGAIDPVCLRRPAAPQVGGACALRLYRKPDILADGEIGKQVGDLEGAADAAAGAFGGTEAGDVLPVQMHRARRRRKLTGHQVEIGRLAGAVRADDGGERSRLKRAADAVDGHMAAEANGQVARLKNRSGHLRPPRDAAYFGAVIGSGMSFAGMVATSSSMSLSLPSFLIRQ